MVHDEIGNIRVAEVDSQKKGVAKFLVRNLVQKNFDHFEMLVFDGELKRTFAHFVRDVRLHFAFLQQTMHEHVVTVCAGEQEEIVGVFECFVVVRSTGGRRDRTAMRNGRWTMHSGDVAHGEK